MPVRERTGLSDVKGLHDFWASRSFQPGATSLPEIQWRILLDTLGLGIEQTATRFAERPDFATFEAWVLATAGRPDTDKLARYHA